MTNKINHHFAVAMTKLQYTDPEAHAAVQERLEASKAYTQSWIRRALAAEKRAARPETEQTQ